MQWPPKRGYEAPEQNLLFMGLSMAEKMDLSSKE
jgi:hypothetical protein